jgi:cupin superfamily acireductone dioxygenase involved in methionine salvage
MNKFGLFRPFFINDINSPVYKLINAQIGDLTVTSEMITVANEVIDELDNSEEYKNYDVIKSPTDKTVGIIGDHLIKKFLERKSGSKPDQKFVNDANNTIMRDIKEDPNIKKIQKELLDSLFQKEEGEEETFT